MTKQETWTGLREFKRAGHYFALLSSGNPVDVTAYGADDQVLASELQVTAGYFIDRTRMGADGKLVAGFQRIEITTTGSDTVKFIITDGKSGTTTIPNDVTDRAGRLIGVVYGTLGQLLQILVNGLNALAVKVLSAFEDESTRANAAFQFGANLAAGGAATFQHLQAFNPVGSTIITYVDTVTFALGTAGGLVHVREWDTAATTDLGAFRTKNRGIGTAGQSHLRNQAPGAMQGTFVKAFAALVSVSYTVKFNPPIRLAAGQGIAVADSVGNGQLIADFEIREQAT